MERLGILTGADLRNRALPDLQRHFGKSGTYFYWISRAIDERQVRANRVRKSVGAENTFSEDLYAFEPMKEALQSLIAKVWRHCEATGTRARTVTLKIKFADFNQLTRCRSLAQPVETAADLEDLAIELLKPMLPVPKGVRLLGVSLSSLNVGEHDHLQLRFEI